MIQVRNAIKFYQFLIEQRIYFLSLVCVSLRFIPIVAWLTCYCETLTIKTKVFSIAISDIFRKLLAISNLYRNHNSPK